MINKELLQLILDAVKANPEYWQENCPQIASHKPCFVGVSGILNTPLPFCVLDNGTLAYEDKTILDTICLLGIARYQAVRLFNPCNSWEQMQHILTVLLNTDVPLFSSM